jgi:CDP-L-myo-inositol myo-inositolphosphotransferase
MAKAERTPSKFDFQKSLKEATPYPILNRLRVERYFTRPLAALIVHAVYNTSITPNQLTYFSFFLGICSGISFSMGQYIFFIGGGVLAQLSSVFDCADGMLARSKNLASEYGAILDIFLDRIAEFFIFSGIAIGFFRYSGNSTLFLIGVFSLALYFLQTTLYYLMIMFESKKTGLAAEARGFLIFVILVFSSLNRLDVLICLLSFVTLTNVLFKLIRIIRWGRSQGRDTKS